MPTEFQRLAFDERARAKPFRGDGAGSLAIHATSTATSVGVMAQFFAMRLTSLGLLCLLIGMSKPAPAKDDFQQPASVHLDQKGEKWARESLKKMSLEQKIGQMFMIWSQAQFMNADSPEYIRLRDTMRKYHLGGFGLTVHYEDGFLYKNEPLEAAMVTNQLQKDSEFPLLFAADFERGLAFRLKHVTEFPHAMAFGATNNPEFARQAGRITAQEARAIGVHWNWFPVADVNSNPANPIINVRSFGEDPKQVGGMVAAYIEGAHEFGMLTTAKHFPGHGDTETDSHLALPSVNRDKNYFDTVSLPPFRAAIMAGVDAVQVAHIAVPALDPDPHHVASISPAIVTGLLQEQMGFTGLVITDAMDMHGLTKLFPEGVSAASARAAVKAVKAGNDVLLLPSDLDSAYNGLLRAVRSGEIAESRINQSVLKLLRAKASVGLNKATLVDINAINETVAGPESLAVGQSIADNAVTLVRDNRRVLPLKAASQGTNQPPSAYSPPVEPGNRTLVLIFSDDSRSETGRTLDQQVRMRIPDAKVIYFDSRDAARMAQTVMDAVQPAEAIILAIYAAPEAGKAVRARTGAVTNQVAPAESSAALLHQVLQSAAA